MSHVTVISGRERRRRWSGDDRRRVLTAASVPGAIVADVARRFEVSTSLIYKWRREATASAGMSSFVPAVIMEGPGSPPCGLAGTSAAIVVELAGGTRVTIGGHAPVSMVSAALRALAR